MADARLDDRKSLCERLGLGEPEHVRLPANRLILAAWQKWGPDCARHLTGDFAFAIWDIQRRTLFCARDQLGVRPFYYHLSPGTMAFATDIGAVLSVPNVSDQLDPEYVTAWLADKQFYRKDRTYFGAVRRLPPGYTLLVQPQSHRLERYWFPESAGDIRFTRDSEYAEAAREICERAVADRLRTRATAGVHLSGGLDSSCVAALAARECRRQGLANPLAFSGQPAHVPDSAPTREHSQIDAVCTREGISPIYCPPNSDDILAVLRKDPAREPVNSTLPVEITIQREAAARGVRLIMAGWGGDEGLSFDGRGYYGNLLLSGKWKQLYQEGRWSGAPLRFMAREALLLLSPDRTEGLRKLSTRSLRAKPLLTSFLHPDLHGQVRLHKIPCRQTSVRSTMLWLWTRGSLAERMESWAAHGAQRGISYVYPLLDRRLLEFLAGLPPEQFIRGQRKRWLMRTAMEGILPDEVRWQPDKGEPMRFDLGLKASHHAFDLARQRLTSGTVSPARARYLDMPRLLDRMRPERLSENPKPGDIIRALQFLDF